MNLVLRRFASLKEATIGALYIAGEFECFSLEDQFQPGKVEAETRIPAGTYSLSLRLVGRLHEKYKAKFPDWHKGMIELTGVPGFTGVLLHIGNTERDTAGCVLVGDCAMATGELAQSTQAYERVYQRVSQAILLGETCQIEVRDD